VPGGSGRLANCDTADRYCAAVVVDVQMRDILALIPARLFFPISDRKAVALRSESSAKKK